MIVLAFLLTVDPEHAKEHAKNSQSKDAILIVGDIDAGLDKEKAEGDD